MGAAGDAIRRHMEALVEELTEILHTQVLEPYRREPHSPEDAAKLERTMARLRQLTLEAVVTGFQRAANAVIRRSSRPADLLVQLVEHRRRPEVAEPVAHRVRRRLVVVGRAARREEPQHPRPEPQPAPDRADEPVRLPRHAERDPQRLVHQRDRHAAG